MSKNLYINELREMLDSFNSKNTNKKTILESIVYSENEQYDDEVKEEHKEEEKFSSSKVLSHIRKLCIKAIAELSDNTEDPNYELFKKIWNMTDKTETKKSKDNQDIDDIEI